MSGGEESYLEDESKNHGKANTSELMLNDGELSASSKKHITKKSGSKIGRGSPIPPISTEDHLPVNLSKEEAKILKKQMKKNI